MIIDFHTHIFPPEIIKNRDDYLKNEPLFAELYSSPKARLITAEELIENMDREGVDLSVALNIGWTSQEICRRTNDYILESVARYPGRLVGFGMIPPRAGESALREIEYCAQGGARGIGELRPDTQNLDLKDKQFLQPFVELLQKYQLILLTHSSEPVGHSYFGKGKVTPEVLYPFIANFPDLTIVCAHWGGGLPFYALMPEVAASLANTFFDTAASPFLYRPQIFKYVAEIVSPEKILFGSDYPLMPIKRIRDQIESVGLEQKSMKLILGENARRLLY
jgi:hypothetical protein